MNRRDFLQAGVVVCGSALTAARADAGLIIQAVTGSVPAREIGPTLPHEHVLVDFIGATQVSPSRYNADEVFQVALPHLKNLRSAGCRTFFDCTPAYIGRDVTLLRRLAEASGLTIVTNTGYYGAANDKYVPAHAYKETAEQLATRWVREWQEGIEGAGIRPGFIKIGVDNGPLSEIDRKLVRAAALAHLQSGLTVAAHTGDWPAAREEWKIFQDNGVDASALIWVHAKEGDDGPNVLRAFASAGGWVELDNIGPNNADRVAELVLFMKSNGNLNRVLLSQDAGWYHVGELRGGNFRPFDYLFRGFLPILQKRGLSQADVKKLVEENPAEAFAVKIRRWGGRSRPNSGR